MFQGCILWLSHLWGLLCEFTTPSTPVTQTPSTSASDAMATTTNSQPQPIFVSTSTPTCWHVFLSFRGEDTRLTFTSYLHDKLESNGIRTFMDKPELGGGEVISDALLDAIRKSKAYIVVFSENYATSSWCLNELVEILNCHKAAERLVIPVFYKIDPSVIRYQTGSFKQAFEKHRDRVEMEKVNKWCLALKQVADLSGHHISDSEDRSEVDFIKEIVDKVLLKINPQTLYVTKYPVGLVSRVEAITTLLSSNSEGVIKFGIYGMGGVGKTTLAKALYNQLLEGRSFKGSCFLTNVREASGTFQGMESLQQQLINDVLDSTTKVEVHNVEQGINLIRERVSSAKVLILIDDIYDPEQYESLTGPFASGSVVIITTRDEEMLDNVGVEPNYRYMLKELDYAQSRELFTRYAFEKAEPTNNLLALRDDILRLASGLPLALKIFGSYLSTKKEGRWKSYIETLQQYPNSTIEQKLLISLDALELDDRMLKKIFIDIACFFIGWNNESAVEVLGTYYSHADEKIDILKKRCLLTVNKEKLEMHDLLRDMGRNVARNKAPDEPGKYSRLWLPEDIEDVLKNYKGTEAIEGIIPHNFQNLFSEGALEGKSFTTETFKWMRKLRFLYLKKVNLTGSFEQMFEDLRVLRWEYCPLKCLPSDFYPEKLVILELPHSNMKTMWDLNMVSHVFGKLKNLDMFSSRYLTTTPDFTKLPCLETLNLGRCESLEEVHMSIGSLSSLVSLYLRSCVKLRSLPDTICDLRALKVLNISMCSSLEALPLQLGNIESLTEIYANSNEKLETLPDSICNLRSLEILNIADCWSLEALPTEIGNIESLKMLEVDGLTVSKLPDSIGSLTKLVELDLSSNKKLETLPDALWKITRLRKLIATDTTLLKKLPDIGSSQIALSLQELDLSRSGITALPYGFSQLSNLEELDLSCCRHLLSIPKLPSNLKHIDASCCDSLERIPNLSNLKHLETLEVLESSGLTYIQGLEGLISIERLGLGGCSGLTNKALTKRLFQLYSEFGHQINVEVPECLHEWSQWPDWILESPYWTSQSQYWTSESINSGSTTSESINSGSTTVYAHLLPNESHNFMGIILCFQWSAYNFSVKNTTSGFIWSGSFESDDDYNDYIDPLMVIVPKSIFSVTDEDHRIEFTGYSNNSNIDGIHLLYKTETKTIEDIEEKHVIDIDALKLIDPVLHDIFLDIACFFIGWEIKKVVQILETYYTNVHHNIDILKNRCLLTTNARHELEMDDLHQYLGRKIACNNSRDEPEKHSRLWLSIDIYDVLKNHKGTEAIQGIIPRNLHTKDALEGESFTMETFKMMSKLRFLYLKKVNFTGKFEQTFEELRWFCWDFCPLKCLPSNFCPQELVTLELPHSNMTTFWEPNVVSNVFGKLKTLNMSYSQDLITTPDFIKLPCLENLNLGNCKSLEEVHMSIGSLAWLVSLDLHGCAKLRSLPDSICNLRSLQELILSRSGITALPSGFSQLSNLEYLHLNSCDHLFSIPKLPPNLKQIYASGCFSLERLPNLSNLKQLEELNLSYCSGLTEIEGLDELSSMRRLRLEGGRRISLLAYKHLTPHLFQSYSAFGQQISVYAPEPLNWKSRPESSKSKSRPQSSKSSKSVSTMYAELLPNESHNFLGTILCFKRHPKDYISTSFGCSVKNTTSGFIWRSDSLDVPLSEFLFVMVPKTIFSITDGDNRIELTANTVIIVWIYPLYKKTEMIEDGVNEHETSFDALKLVDPVLQDIFLDIACFFIGSKKKVVVPILETYYPDVDGAIDFLKNRCLLTISDRDELGMNFLLQHTAREIARNKSADEPGKHSRLWLSIDIHDVLKKQTGTETIKVIIPRYVYSRKDALQGESFTSEAFKKMSKLRFLYLKNVNISGSFQQAFEDLRWLHWDSCPLKCLPYAFHPQKLVTLELPNSNMRTMLEPNMVSHVFESLKTLNMSFSQHLTTTPDFNKLPCLVTLILEGCISLEEVHISIGNLVRLVSLDLHGCVKLRSLPRTICNLRALKVLDIHDCCSLEALPTELGSIKLPRELVAENLTVSKLPDSIGHLSNKNLKTLTDTICNLRSLEFLDISRCEKLEILLNQLFTLTRLRELKAGGATLLRIHPDIGLNQMALSLQKLDFSDSVLTALPSAISQLTNIEYLDLKDCRHLLSITELPPNLKGIRAFGCKSMQRFPNLSNLKLLETLELTDCSGLSDIQGLKGLTSVRDLHLEGCNSTFLENIFTKCFFQTYSEFGHPIQISAPLAEFPYWIRQSSEYGSTMCLELLPNVLHHFSGMILCFKSLGSSTKYTIKNTTRDFIWSGSLYPCSRNPVMVIVPRSTFSVSDGDDRIELTTEDAEIYGIHLLYKTKVFNSTTVNED